MTNWTRNTAGSYSRTASGYTGNILRDEYTGLWVYSCKRDDNPTLTKVIGHGETRTLREAKAAVAATIRAYHSK